MCLKGFEMIQRLRASSFTHSVSCWGWKSLVRGLSFHLSRFYLFPSPPSVCWGHGYFMNGEWTAQWQCYFGDRTSCSFTLHSPYMMGGWDNLFVHLYLCAMGQRTAFACFRATCTGTSCGMGDGPCCFAPLYG